MLIQSAFSLLLAFQLSGCWWMRLLTSHSASWDPRSLLSRIQCPGSLSTAQFGSEIHRLHHLIRPFSCPFSSCRRLLLHRSCSPGCYLFACDIHHYPAIRCCWIHIACRSHGTVCWVGGPSSSRTSYVGCPFWIIRSLRFGLNWTVLILWTFQTHSSLCCTQSRYCAPWSSQLAPRSHFDCNGLDHCRCIPS